MKLEFKAGDVVTADMYGTLITSRVIKASFNEVITCGRRRKITYELEGISKALKTVTSPRWIVESRFNNNWSANQWLKHAGLRSKRHEDDKGNLKGMSVHDGKGKLHNEPYCTCEGAIKICRERLGIVQELEA